jgi:hypothetical protein
VRRGLRWRACSRCTGSPRVWFGNNGVISITEGATLPAGAGILALSVLPLPPALRSVKALLALPPRSRRARLAGGLREPAPAV